MYVLQFHYLFSNHQKVSIKFKLEVNIVIKYIIVRLTPHIIWSNFNLFLCTVLCAICCIHFTIQFLCL